MEIWCNYETAFWISSPGVYNFVKISSLYNLLIVIIIKFKNNIFIVNNQLLKNGMKIKLN